MRVCIGVCVRAYGIHLMRIRVHPQWVGMSIMTICEWVEFFFFLVLSIPVFLFGLKNMPHVVHEEVRTHTLLCALACECVCVCVCVCVHNLDAHSRPGMYHVSVCEFAVSYFVNHTDWQLSLCFGDHCRVVYNPLIGAGRPETGTGSLSAMPLAMYLL